MEEDYFSTGMVLANFRQDGMTAWARARPGILVKMVASWWAYALITLPGTLSGPVAFQRFTASCTRVTSCSPTVSGVVQELVGGVGRAGAAECRCCDVSKREKKLFSSSASGAIRSPAVAWLPL